MSELAHDAVRAEHLIEALPYILAYQGATIVIKFGGHAMLSESLQDGFAKDVTLLRLLGFKPVVVHGGGPGISRMLDRLSIGSRFVEGLRYTDPETLEVVEMVLSGSIGKDIAGRITRAGGLAVGLSGKDALLIEAKKAAGPKGPGGEELDVGLVGEPVAVNRKLLSHLGEGGFIPVIAPVGADREGGSWNINADTAAAAVAGALAARRLILLTDVEGVLDRDGKLLLELDREGIARLKAEGMVTGGMIPKLDCCLEALESGCSAASIIDGRVPHSLLLEIFTHRGCGTEVKLSGLGQGPKAPGKP
ncbi:MAG: acetylglutamate kinase [Deltaproteobacteria bacterium]|nr:acetylglutamate kinase [Deltaproteobacteria bacterium]